MVMGLTDLLIGTSGAYDYVVYGSRTPFPSSLNLTSLNGTNGFAVNVSPFTNNDGST